MFEAPQRDSVSRDLVEATRRLERALGRLESGVAGLMAKPSTSPEPDLFRTDALETDKARLEGELDMAQARVRALEETAAAASDALGRAVLEVRAALGENTGGDDNKARIEGEQAHTAPDAEGQDFSEEAS